MTKVSEADRHQFITEVLELVGVYMDVDIFSEENAETYDSLDGDIQSLMQEYLGFDWRDNNDYNVELIPHV